MSGIRVLVANKTQAELYDLPTRRSALKPMRTFINPAGKKRESALGTSRPGRMMNRSGGVRQAYESKHGIKEQAEEDLVRQVATALAAWNEFLLALLYIQDDDLKTIPTGLLAFSSRYQTDYSMLFSALAIVTIPMVVIYIAFNRHIVDGITAGSVK